MRPEKPLAKGIGDCVRAVMPLGRLVPLVGPTGAQMLGTDGMEFDPVQQRLGSDGAGVGRSHSQRLLVLLTGTLYVSLRDRTKGHEVYGVDMDLPGADVVAATYFDFGAAPEPERDRDIPFEDAFS